MKFSHFSKVILCSILIATFLLPNISTGLASENLEVICQWNKIEQKPENLSDKDYEALLRKCQEFYQQKSEAIESDINSAQKKKNTLRNKIYILKKRIQSLDYQIYQANIMIRDLNSQISNTELSISKTNQKIEGIKKNLANILQLRYEEDKISPVEIMLANGKLSTFFDDLMALEALNSETQNLLENIKDLKSDLENQRDAMDKEKDDLERVVTIQRLQKEQSNQVKKEQERFLRMTEAEYQRHLQEKKEVEAKVAKIRERIFALIGVAKAPTFGEALKLAKYVENITGVRPAFLLAVLTQESNIGKNVGQCYLKNLSTGSGIVASTGKFVRRVMKPSRDIKPFLAITKELGRDPLNTLVSCPMSYGWGGAMGPGQFIPSTWIKYSKRVQKITGKPADPWNIKDAFLATALYLKDFGADRQTYNAEWRAAMIYFAGSVNWRYRFYGNSVMSIARNLQADIQTIESASK